MGPWVKISAGWYYRPSAAAAIGPDLPFVSRPVAAVRAVEGDIRRGSEI